MAQKDFTKYKQSFDYKIERFANKATNFVGSPMSLVLHTVLFISSFLLILFGVDRNTVLLVLTTIVSLEAIYLSLFIQMSVNRSNRRLYIVKKELDEIQEGVEEIQEDVEEIQKDVEEIQEDVEDIQEDVQGIEEDIDEIQEDVEGIEKDIDEIQEDVEGLEKDVDELAEDIDQDEVADRARDELIIQSLEGAVAKMMQELEILKAQTEKKRAVGNKQSSIDKTPKKKAK